MKLTHLSSLFCAAATMTVASMIASVSPAHALEFVQNGTFNAGSAGWSTSGGASNFSGGTWNFSDTTAILSQTINGLLVGQTYTFSFNYAQPGLSTNLITASYGGVQLGSYANSGYLGANPINTFTAGATSGALTFNAYESNGFPAFGSIDNISLTGPAAVPFDIPGGATIPALGGLLALGVIRKTRKRIASKTRLANPVAATVS